MNRLFLFLKQIYVPLLFLILEVAAISHYAGSTSYSRARILGASNLVGGRVYKGFSNVRDYFGLKGENRLLIEQLTALHNELELYRALHPAQEDSLVVPEGLEVQYAYTSATVINNSIHLRENFLTIDKGRLDGIEPNMAVITPDGCIVGIVQMCSDKYSVCMSVLNDKFRTAGRIKGTDHFGAIFWDGAEENTVQLTEVSKYAQLNPGDTVVTDHSSIFPPNILIGTIESAEMEQASFYNAQVQLATPLTSVRKVLLVRYADQIERQALEENARNTVK